MAKSIRLSRIDKTRPQERQKAHPINPNAPKKVLEKVQQVPYTANTDSLVRRKKGEEKVNQTKIQNWGIIEDRGTWTLRVTLLDESTGRKNAHQKRQGSK